MPWVFLFLLIFLTSTSRAGAKTASYVSGIAQINSQTGMKGFAGNQGTAFLVDAERGLLVTNLHNLYACAYVFGIKNYWQIPKGALVGKHCAAENFELHFQLAEPEVTTRGIDIVAHGSTAPGAAYEDWALIKINCEECRSIPALELAEREARPGEKVTVLGYPMNPRVGRPVVRGTELRRRRGVVKSEKKTLKLWESLYRSLELLPEQFMELRRLLNDQYIHDRQMYMKIATAAGYSGSPILNSEDKVVGILWGSLSIWNGKYGAHPRKTLMDGTRPNKPANGLVSGFRLSWLKGFLKNFKRREHVTSATNNSRASIEKHLDYTEYCMALVENSVKEWMDPEYEIYLDLLTVNPGPVSGGSAGTTTMRLSGPASLTTACHEAFHVFNTSGWQKKLIAQKQASNGRTTPLWEAAPQIMAVLGAKECHIGKEGRKPWAYDHCQALHWKDLPSLKETATMERGHYEKILADLHYWDSILMLPEETLSKPSAYYSSIPLGYTLYHALDICGQENLIGVFLKTFAEESWSESKSFDSIKAFTPALVANIKKYLPEGCTRQVEEQAQALGLLESAGAKSPL